jgi:tetratricopeptide (TPR) repeat protein
MPKNIQLAYALGGAYIDSGKLDSAITVLEKAAKIGKEHAETFDNQDCYADLHANLGAAYLKKGLNEKAVSALENGLKQGDNPKLLNNLAAAYMALDDPKNALVSVSKALKLAPNDISLLTNFASILMRIGRIDHALVVYRKLLEIDKENKESLQKKISELEKVLK